ncbi:MAG: TadE/TadG family type IV pilus assembly protein [Chloroflexota bacterium]
MTAVLIPITRRQRRRRSAGQALVEFALAIPIFVFLLFGLIDLGRLVYINNALAEAAREGARWGSVQGRSGTAAGMTSIASYTAGMLAAVPSPTVTVTCQDRNLNPVATCRTDYFLSVQVSSQVSMFTPVIAGLVGTNTYSATSKVTVNQ